MLHFIDHPTRYVFFTGKGGVGKTSLACATAIALADRGSKVLLVSTDPASNLGHVLETAVTGRVESVAAIPNLWVVDIDPEAAAGAYRERVVGPMRGILPEAALRQVEEQLSGACTTEIAAFDEFTKLLTVPHLHEQFDHIILDTAPTGHTLRLLQLPAAWSDFIEENPGGASCLGPLSGLEAQRAQYAAAVDALNDPEHTTLILVSRPERAALEEAERTSVELAAIGVQNQRLVVNGVFQAGGGTDPLALAMKDRAEKALQAMPARLRMLPRDEVPLKGHNIVGVRALRTFLHNSEDVVTNGQMHTAPIVEAPSLQTLVDDMAAAEKGLILFMGKGGVGKTTLAAAVAVELVRRGYPVHLSTTDPAAHVAATVEDGIDGLTISRIDPREETQRYIDHVLASKGKHLDEEGRALLEEDLRSPCTEEVAVFHAFSRLVHKAARGFVVLDTAPTGHTLLLLDATGAYHRDVIRNTHLTPGNVTTPLMRLQDPDYTKLLIVTLAETTPVLEAAELQADLRRAGIEPYAWVVNQSLAAARPSAPLLIQRAHAELSQIADVRDRYAARVALVPWLPEEPVGSACLRALMQSAEAPKQSVEHA